MPGPITVTARLDRSLAWENGESVRYLVVDLAAPAVEQQTSEPRVPLNLGLVIDASGSMAGDPIASAKAAAAGLADRLADGDALSIISFDTDVAVHASGVKLDASARQRVKELVRQVEAGSSTNLSGGWLAGAATVAAVMEREPGQRNRVVLLSDGHANAGITQPEILEHHAAELAARGLFTSTVGIGEGYSPIQLHAIAEHGGGRMHDVDLPDEIVEVVMAEIDDAMATVAEDVKVALSFPAPVKVDGVSRFPSESAGGRFESRLGSLIGNAARRAVFRLTLPAGTAGDVVSFTVVVTWRNPGSDDVIASEPVVATIRFAGGVENSAQPRDIEGSLAAARTWQGAIVRRVAELNIEGVYEEATRYAERELTFFQRYCEGLPGSEELVSQLQDLLGVAGRSWSALSRKTVMARASEVQYSRSAASRLRTQLDWTDVIREEGDRGQQVQ